MLASPFRRCDNWRGMRPNLARHAGGMHRQILVILSQVHGYRDV